MKRPALPWRLVALLAVAAALLFVRLGVPDWTPTQRQPGLPKRYVWDECYYAFTVHRFLEGDPDVMRVDATFKELAAFDASDLGPNCGYAVYHPPLATYAMTASAWAFGWTPVAVRLPGALCGLAIVACTWIFVRRLRDERTATLAALLVAFDGVWFTISRLAIPHVYVAAATTAALTAGLVAWQDDARRARWTLVTGALCGLGLAFKTSAVTVTVLLALALLVRAVTRGAAGSRGRALVAWGVAFVVLPPLVYLASWTPFFVHWGRSWDDFVAAHETMRAWHTSMPATMGPSTPWWSWPVVWKPVALFEDAQLGRYVVCRGNPFLWWAAVAAVPWAAVRFARRRDVGDLWIVAGYLAAWVVFAFVPRFGFSYYMLPAAPLAAAAVATALDDVCAGSETAPRFATWTFAALAAGTFAAMYPWIAAVPAMR